MTTEEGAIAAAIAQIAFNNEGLVPAIAQQHDTGEVLMLAWMNAEALSATLATRTAHFWSRSRRRLWKKGEESGNVLHIEDLRTDCDQDALWLRVKVAGAGVACHTGERSCFYRALPLGVSPTPELLMKRAAPA